ncbi:MAG: phosphoglucomutase [Desulfurococcaceae archaeon]
MRIHGRAFKDITLEKAIKIGAAIGQIAGVRNLVVSGRDSLRVSRMLKRAITAGVMSSGAEVMDFHASLTGEITYAIKRFGAKMGFMVSYDPSKMGVLIRIYSSPGTELLGGDLKDILEILDKNVEEPQEVGWIYYAEYMHRLYAAAVSSFVKGDVISSRKQSIVIGPDFEPIDIILAELSRTLRIDQTIIGGPHVLKYPMCDTMNKIGKVVDALGADLGVLLSHDGASISIYLRSLGYLTPEELFLIALEKYSPGSRVTVLNPISSSFVKYVEKKGFDVMILSNEQKLQYTNRRERPVLSLTWRGEYVTPVFSLGYDSVIIYTQILESIAENNSRLINEISLLRQSLNINTVEYDQALKICSEKSNELTLWGCRFVENNQVTTLIYQPANGRFMKVVDKVAEVNTE